MPCPYGNHQHERSLRYWSVVYLITARAALRTLLRSGHESSSLCTALSAIAGSALATGVATAVSICCSLDVVSMVLLQLQTARHTHCEVYAVVVDGRCAGCEVLWLSGIGVLPVYGRRVQRVKWLTSGRGNALKVAGSPQPCKLR